MTLKKLGKLNSDVSIPTSYSSGRETLVFTKKQV